MTFINSRHDLIVMLSNEIQLGADTIEPRSQIFIEGETL